jgi:uncharacterized protein (UPF0128 family)
VDLPNAGSVLAVAKKLGEFPLDELERGGFDLGLGKLGGRLGKGVHARVRK